MEQRLFWDTGAGAALSTSAFPVTLNTPMPNTHTSLMYQWCYIILAVHSIIKYNTSLFQKLTFTCGQEIPCLLRNPRFISRQPAIIPYPAPGEASPHPHILPVTHEFYSIERRKDSILSWVWTVFMCCHALTFIHYVKLTVIFMHICLWICLYTHMWTYTNYIYIYKRIDHDT